ncbi:hypothetical protein ACH4VS_34460 [Streptomyces hygroscopicus]|uniref:hypothetical protein n=1 Tax=Streptomyces hygroscopicus TaxID=1912 RepID=UPI00082B5B07|nr:hypothetical protein [Streptomyces hygroscopicus]
MRPLARLRTSAALWLAPVCLAIVLLYFFNFLHQDSGYRRMLHEPKWAPSIVSRVLDTYYWFAYSVAAGLGAWEAGRLKKDGVWRLAPARSRYRVAAEALLPGALVGWLMLLLPVAMALIEMRVWPTPNSLPLLGMGLFLVCAHTVIGFTVGLWVHRVISAPLLAAAVLYLVGWSASDGERLWPQHLSGQYTGGLMFGELIPFTSLWPHLFLAGSLATACALAWVRLRARAARIALRCASAATAVVVMAACVVHVHSWGAVSPLSYRNAPMECAGNHPRACVPRAAHADLPAIRDEVTRTVTALRSAGLNVPMPDTVNDSLAAGRSAPRSAERVWWLPLSEGTRRGSERLRLQIALRFVRFPCRKSDAVNSRSAALYAATAADADRLYLRWQKTEMQSMYTNPDEVLAVMKRRVARARALPRDKQASWYRHELVKACENAGKDGAS